jgi:acetyl-CoA acyltransferase 1
VLVTLSSLQVIELQKAQDCLLPMGITSENVAQRYGVTREEQDKAAAESHMRAAAATASGKFKDEIIPVHTKVNDIALSLCTVFMLSGY